MAIADVTAIRNALDLILSADGTALRLPLLGMVREEQSGELAQRLQVTVPNLDTPRGKLHQLVALAGQVVAYADWGTGPAEVFRGTIWDWTFGDDGKETIHLTCYDNLYYLQKSKDDLHYNNGFATPGLGGSVIRYTAGTIMADVATHAGTAIAGTDQLLTLMPTIAWSAQTYATMILDLLDKTYWLGGGSWLLRSTQGNLAIVAPAQNTPIYLLTSENIGSYTDEQSMEDLVTRVYVQGVGNTSVAPMAGLAGVRQPIEQILDGRTEFGIMTDFIHDVAVPYPGGVPTLAKIVIGNRGQPRRVQHFDAPDLPFLRRGDAIAVNAGTLNGTFIITGISHDADRQRMQITVDTSGDLTASSVNFQPLDIASDTGARGQINPYRDVRSADTSQ